MIIGVGVDIVKISRIEDVINRYGQAFLDKVFTTGEQEYCQQAKRPFERYAARFAAKEAFFKALGTGLRSGMHWTDAEVVLDEWGKPFMVAHGLADVRIRQLGATTVWVSMSHNGDYAVAHVVLEGI